MAKVVVFLKASAESTTALLTAGSEGCREPPLLIVPAVAGLLLHVVLVPIGAVDARAFVSSMSKLVNQAISKVAKHVTVIFFHEFTIGVGLPDQVELLVEVGHHVSVPEGGAEGADVGGPGRHRAAGGGDSEHRNLRPRVGDGVTWTGGVLGPRREAWR